MTSFFVPSASTSNSSSSFYIPDPIDSGSLTLFSQTLFNRSEGVSISIQPPPTSIVARSPVKGESSNM